MNPREMERYNPFAADQPAELASGALSGTSAATRQPFSAGGQRATSQTRDISSSSEPGGATSGLVQQTSSASSGRYSTSFPDPFGADEAPETRFVPAATAGAGATRADSQGARQPPSNRSNSVTFMHRVGERDGQDQDQDRGQPLRTPVRGSRQAGGFTSFLSRATSVTSSSVTDRVSGAVDSMRSAVDSLSSQFSQAVPSSTGNLISNAFSQDQPRGQQQTSGGADLAQQESRQQQQQQQSAASYLASRLSSATNQFVGATSSAGSTGGGGPFASSSALGSQIGNQLDSGGQTATINRQRVVLILDNLSGGTDWPQQFTQYRRLISGLAPQSSASLAFTSFLAAQFSSSSSGSGSQLDGLDSDLIEQVSFKDVSVLANQSSATAAVYVSGPSAGASSSSASSSSSSSLPINRLAFNIVSGGGSGGSSSSHQQQQGLSMLQQQQQQQHAHQQFGSKTVRPEYVVVRQRGREHLSHLKSIVKALDYCAVPMFEPYEVWNVFQDRQQIFAKLLRVQRQLGKENFPLIPQLFCQTHQDLLNYINNSSVCLPCLVRTGPLGKGKIRINNLQMLKDFATIMATSGQSCTIEQYLDVKCDLIVQKLGTSLKLFKGRTQGRRESFCSSTGGQENEQPASSLVDPCGDSAYSPQRQSTIGSQADSSSPYTRQTTSRQTSLAGGAAGLFGLMSQSGSVGGSSQLLRNNSNPMQNQTAGNNFEKLSEVNARYRQWVEAIFREFDNKIDVFCIKIVVASNDREYIVGLRNCSMEFLGNQENQDEDKRSLVELIISKMNTVLPKHQTVSREPSAAALPGGQSKRKSMGGNSEEVVELAPATENVNSRAQPPRLGGSDKRATFLTRGETSGQEMSHQQQHNNNNNNMLNNRNRSVSMNQGEPPLRPLNQTEWGQSGLRHSQLSSGPGQQRPPAPHQLPRRASDRSDSLLTNNDDFSLSQTIDSPLSSSSTSARQQSSLGQSFFDQTSTALSSFQRQSLSFLRRLETRTGGAEFGVAATGTGSGGTPPLSAKSDSAFDRGPMSNGSMDRSNYGTHNSNRAAAAASTAPNSVKSQSVDVNPSDRPHSSSQAPPPKPPPPPLSSLINRQSSLANYSSSSIHQQRGHQHQHRVRSDSSSGVASPLMSSSPKGGAAMTPQNSISQSSFSDETRASLANGGAPTTTGQQRQPPPPPTQQRFVRQNSALSAFEPFDASLRSESYIQNQDENQQAAAAPTSGLAEGAGRTGQSAQIVSGNRQSSGNVKFDSVSMKSGNSNTSDETTSAEDTMNNLKRTFASIFGDKCE